PIFKAVTAGPTASTTPAASVPGVYGSLGPRLSVFDRRYVSTGFTPTAWLRTSTWVAPGSGVGASSLLRTDGPPYSETRMDFIGRSPFVCVGRAFRRRGVREYRGTTLVS